MTSPSYTLRLPCCWVLQLMVFLLLMGASSGARQRFRQRPQSVEVAEGSDVLLRCDVENQQGRAQWTKDGFALGFDRAVPGYPRFSYLGSESVGQHHLLVTGVTTTEAGEYQCQVGPGPNSPAIWATANITVLVPPRSVVVEGRSEGERVVVEKGGSLALQCVAGEARPPSTLTWLSDGVPLTSGVVEAHRVEGSGRGRGWRVRSELEVRVGAQDDGRRYTCQATHPAITTPLTASVTLAVLHAPSPPRISRYRAGQVVTAGQEVRLTCRATDGFPRPILTWSRNPSPISPSAIATATAATTAFTAASTLRFTATAKDDGAEYVCSAVNDVLQQPLSTVVTLIVYYPPSEVHIRGPRRVGEGRPLNLTCDTSQSNPPAILLWKIQGERVKGLRETKTRLGSGGWVTTSHLTWHGVRSRQVTEVTVECRAVNPSVERSVTKTVTIIVTRPVGAPRFGNDMSREYMAGSNLDLTCSSVGGHPPPSIRLYKGKEQLPTEVWQEGRISWGRVRLGLMATDNGAAISCVVSADDDNTTQPLTTTATLLVKYPPWEVTGWVAPAKVEAESVVRLTCLSSPSRPPATLSWSSPPALTLPDPTTTPQVGLGGPGTRSEVEVRVSAEHDGVVVECTATNGLAQPVSTLLTVHVLHGPLWTRSPPPQVNVSEGSTLIVQAEAAANPGPPSYQWKRGEDDVGGSGGELRVEGVDRSVSGRYTVSAHTDLGTAHAAFMVNVQYAPELVKVKRRVEAERGAGVSVECEAEGNPTPLVTWTRAPSEHTRAGEQEGRARNTDSSNEVKERGRSSSGMGLLSHDVGILGRGEGVARLRVKAAMWTDTGVYLCHAHNPLGSSPPTPLSLVVQQAVRVLGGQGSEGVIWAALGESGRLECRVKAAPPPTFVWSSVGGLILLNSDKYVIHESKLMDGLVTWVSVLEVTDLRPQDYTLYRCTATNALGTQALTLYLRQPGPPFPPHNFTVVNVTEKAAWVSWEANLKGGVPTIYSLRFRTLGATTYKYVEVSGGVRGARLGPLLAGKHYVVGLAARNFHGASQYITATLPPKTAARSPPTPATTMRGPVEEEWGGRRDKPPPHVFPLHLVLTAAAILSVVLAATACIAHRRRRHFSAKTASAVSSDGTNSLATLGVSLSSSPAHVGHVSPQSSPTPVIHAHADVLPLTDPEPTQSYQYDSTKMSSPPPPPHTPPFSTSSLPPPTTTTTNTTTSSTPTRLPTFYPVEPDVCSFSSGVEVGEFQRSGGQVGTLRPVVLLRSTDSLQQQQHQHPQLVQDTLMSLPQQQLDNPSYLQQQNIHSSLLPQQPSIPNSPCQEQTSLSSLSQQLFALCPETQLQQTGLILVPEQQTSFISLPQHEKSSSESITQQQVIVSSLSQSPTILSSLQQQSVSRTSSPHQQKPDIAQSPKECWPDVTDYDNIPIHSQSPQHQIQQSESHLYLHQQHDLQQSPQQQSESHLYHHQLTEQHLHFHQDTQHSPQHTGTLCQSPQHGTSIHQLPQHQRVHLLSPKHHSRTRVPTFSTFQAIPIQPQQQEPTVEQHSPMHYSKSSQQLPQHLIHCHSPRLKARPHQKHSPQLKHRTQQGHETEPQGGGRSGSPHQLLELPQPNTIRQQSPQLEDDSYSLPQQATSLSQPSSPLKYSPQQGSPQQ